MGSVTGLAVYLYVVSCGANFLVCQEIPVGQGYWQEKPACEAAAKTVTTRLRKASVEQGRTVMATCRFAVVGGNKFRPRLRKRVDTRTASLATR